MDKFDVLQVAGQITKTDTGNTVSFWYAINPFTCGLLHNIIFEDDELVFKALTSDTLPFVGAVGYISPTEEFIIGYKLGEDFLPANVLITIPSHDYIRPGGLFVYERQPFFNDPSMWIVAQNSIRYYNLVSPYTAKILALTNI